jgi:glycosyltransferase involved in cell wall biosynthesis
MNFKKILIVTSEFPPQPGGIGNHAYNLALNLVKSKYEVHVLCDTRGLDGREEQEFDKNQPFNIIRIKRKSFIFMTYLNRVSKYKKLIKQVDLVVASGKFPLWLVGLTNKYGRKSIAVIHGSEINYKDLKRLLVNKAIKRFDEIIAVSKHTKSLVKELNLKNITVIPNGFYKTGGINKPRNSIEKSIKLVTVGNVTERKGQVNVINALPNLILRFPNIEYHMIGLPTEKSKLLELAIELKVEEHITFHGRVDEAKKQKILLDCDIFIMLSNITHSGDIEGFGIAIIEANALGLPAIGANNSGITDAICQNLSGRLIDPKSVKELVESIEIIYNDYSNFSENCIAWSTHFDWNKIIKKYINIIE